jgi:GTP-binding protein
MVVQTDWDNEEAIAFLQHRFDRIGLDDALAKAGCRPGDEVRILGYAFSYEGEQEDDAYQELSDRDATVIEDADDARAADEILTVGDVAAAADGEARDEGDAS